MSELVFIEEDGASTKISHRHGTVPGEQRLRCSESHCHRKTPTSLGTLRLGAMTAAMVPHGPKSGAWLLAYAKQELAPSF